MTFDGKIALVTGASGGIGAAIAERIAARGALVAVHYSANRESAQAVVRNIEHAGGKAFALGGDLRSTAGIAALFADLDRALESRRAPQALDFLINNAGSGGGGFVRDTTEQAFDAIFDLNVKGLFFVTQHAIARLRDGGRVVNISSVAARGAGVGRAAYSASKQAVNSLTLSLAAELGPRQVTVNAIAPGAVDTAFIARLKADPKFETGVKAMTAFGRLGTPQDIADAALLLLQPEAHWITGQIIEVSGGLRL